MTQVLDIHRFGNGSRCALLVGLADFYEVADVEDGDGLAVAGAESVDEDAHFVEADDGVFVFGEKVGSQGVACCLGVEWDVGEAECVDTEFAGAGGVYCGGDGEALDADLDSVVEGFCAVADGEFLVGDDGSGWRVGELDVGGVKGVGDAGLEDGCAATIYEEPSVFCEHDCVDG